jgi:excisionase family DNA binding protein
MQKRDLLDEYEAANYLNLSALTLRKWRHEGQGPNYTRLNGHVIRYFRTDLDKFLDRGYVRGR